ncbi:MAG: 1-pyrroline-5-carboxylate dehydrogenase [Proteobacteria bacterium]|nr:1-pyrroline-5-carboxylate dehydrogenase [Pseudomonadota bacterium]
MTTGIFHTPDPKNEPVLSYNPGSAERLMLKKELDDRMNKVIEIPCVVNGKKIFTGRTIELTMPSNHGHKLAIAHLATPEIVQEAIKGSLKAKEQWEQLPWQDRVAIFLKAADLLAGSWRVRLNATTMLAQAKTCHQAEIDAACELIDFWRFNARYTEEILSEQPGSNPGMWNRLDYRPLEGFIFAVTPFNFTSIALNLPTAPAMLGNVALWKPSNTQLYSAWEGMLLLMEAGLPPGVVNFLPGNGADVGDIAMTHPDLAGLHFTGSTGTFQHLWKTIGNNIDKYKTYPRIVGETGGKDFILAHPSADIKAVAIAIIRGAFEFQGQKCSAASRMYIPKSMWPQVKTILEEEIPKMKQGCITNFNHFISAVIDEQAFKKHQEYLEIAHQTAQVIVGGTSDSSQGWYISPTVVVVDDPHHRLMEEEIFGPIATIYVYEDSSWNEMLIEIDKTSPYALTGAVFSQDRYAVTEATSALRNAAGNFYINDKPTGAVVGQQPFGGSRASGTNDKAGSPLNLLRWLSPRTIKETFSPPHDWRYSFHD